MAFLSQAVFAQRLEAMRDLMEREDLQALLLSSPDFCFYASNFEIDVLVWERPVVVGVLRNGSAFAVFSELSANHVAFARERGTLWVEDVTFYSEMPDRAGLAFVGELPGLIAQSLAERDLGGARIGVDAVPGLLEDVHRRLPELTYVSLIPQLRELRFVKTAEELVLARAAADLSDWAQSRYRDGISVGRLVDELDWSVGAQVMQEAAARWPGESLKLRVMSLSGAESAAPHGSGASTGARIESGDVLVNIFVIRLNGITIENERTWLVGRAVERQERAFLAAVKAQDAAIEMMTTGQPVCAAHNAATSVLRDAGFGEFLCHRTGHGMGIGCGAAITAHDFPHNTASETRGLLANELYSVEPGIYLPGIGGFRHDDSVIVGEQAEVLTHAPRGLEDQIIRA